MEQDRYHRQTLLPDFGVRGRQRLADAHAMIVGCGALGCAAADLLGRAGVGRLTIIDRDLVETTNLQRQTLFAEPDVGQPKAEAARARLTSVNSQIAVHALVADFNPASARRLFHDAPDRPDIFIDGTDNFETRLLINDCAWKWGIPYIYAGVVGTRGMVMPVLPGRTCCLRCVVPEAPPPGALPTCETAGVLGPAVAVVAGAQCAEALKVLVGRTDLVTTTLLDFDLWQNERRRLDTAGLKNRECPCCAMGRYEYLLGEASSASAALCGRDAVQILPREQHAGVSLADLAHALEPHGSFRCTPMLLRGTFHTERGEEGAPIELTVFGDGRAIVRGTRRVETARSIYARYVGA